MQYFLCCAGASLFCCRHQGGQRFFFGFPLLPPCFDPLVQQKNRHFLCQQQQAPGAFQKQRNLSRIGYRKHIDPQNVLSGRLVKVRHRGMLRMGTVEGLPQFLVPFGMGKAMGLDDLFPEALRLEGDDLSRLQFQRLARRDLTNQHQRHGRHCGRHTVCEHGIQSLFHSDGFSLLILD